MTFLEELNGDNFSGVAYKNIQLKKNIISFFCTHSSATIADLCKELNLSVPKVTNLINELIQEELVQDLGKINTNGGRRPNLYGLIADSVFFLGVDVKQNHINIGITNLQNELVCIKEHLPFTLSNSTASLEELIQLIHSSLKTFNIPKEKILGMGINLSGRINYATGYSYSFFHFHEEPLAKILENELGIKTFLENDSRAMAYGEFNSEAIKTEKM